MEYCIYFQRKHEERDSDSVCTDFLNDAVFTETLHLCPPISRIKLKAVEPLNTPMLKRYLCNFTQRILSCKTSEIKDKQRFQPCDLEKCR